MSPHIIAHRYKMLEKVKRRSFGKARVERAERSLDKAIGDGGSAG